MREHVPEGILWIDDGKGTARFTLKGYLEEPDGPILTVRVEEEDRPSLSLERGIRGILTMGEEKQLVVIEEAGGYPEIRLRNLVPREDVRVDAMVPIHVKRLPREEVSSKEGEPPRSSSWFASMESIASRLFGCGKGEAFDACKEIEKTHPHLCEVLSGIVSRLDLILYLLANEEDREFLFSRPRRINISGSGIAFWSEEGYEPGEFVGLKIALPLSPPALSHLICEVVSCSRSATVHGDPPSYRVSTRFQSISDETREKIIQFVFQRQRELLRGRNES